MDNLVISLFKNHPILYDKRDTKDPSKKVKVAEALVLVQHDIQSLTGVTLPVAQLQSLWQKNLDKYKRSHDEMEAGGSCSTDPMAFMNDVLQKRQPLQVEIPLSKPMKPKTTKKYKPKKRPCVPPSDKFASRHQFTIQEMQESFRTITNTFNETQNAILNKEKRMPASSSFDMIFRRVKQINKDDYGKVMNRILDALPNLSAAAALTNVADN